MIERIYIEFMKDPCNEIINFYHSRFSEISHKSSEYAIRIKERKKIKSPYHSYDKSSCKKRVPYYSMRFFKTVSSELPANSPSNPAKKVLSYPKRA